MNAVVAPASASSRNCGGVAATQPFCVPPPAIGKRSGAIGDQCTSWLKKQHEPNHERRHGRVATGEFWCPGAELQLFSYPNL